VRAVLVMTTPALPASTPQLVAALAVLTLMRRARDVVRRRRVAIVVVVAAVAVAVVAVRQAALENAGGFLTHAAELFVGELGRFEVPGIAAYRRLPVRPFAEGAHPSLFVDGTAKLHRGVMTRPARKFSVAFYDDSSDAPRHCCRDVAGTWIGWRQLVILSVQMLFTTVNDDVLSRAVVRPILGVKGRFWLHDAPRSWLATGSDLTIP